MIFQRMKKTSILDEKRSFWVQLMQAKISHTRFIPYKKPYLKNVKVEPRQQNVKVGLDPKDSTWKIGFHDADKIGVQAHAEIFNPYKSKLYYNCNASDKTG